MAGSTEFRFAVDCCARSFRGGTGPIDAPADMEWARFLKLVRFHRVEGFVWNALSSGPDPIPDEVRAELSQASSAIVADNLKLAVDCHTLLSNFRAAGVPLLFLKGSTLGALAYANPALKSAIDIDLLVDPVDLQIASELLRNAGYSLVAPRRHDLIAWHRGWKESVWAKGDLQIDLHTRTADNPRLIRGIGVHSPGQMLSIAEGIELPTLADEELFAYLAVHGASSAWFRLKWISDFGGFLYGRSSEDLLHLYGRSQKLGAGRAAGQALLLAHELFGALQVSPALADELRRDRTIVSLYRTALQLVTGEPVEPTEHRFGTFPIHRSQFQLLPGIGYKLSELSQQVRRIVIRDH